MQVAKKKMSPTNARALNTMRQRLKKHNQGYQEQMDAFREKPESSEEDAASGAACTCLPCVLLL
jgi:translation initiation factor 3 subunit C